MSIPKDIPYLIPINLIDLQRKGQVIFFCGAGVSLSKGLPSFLELTKQIVSDFNIIDPGLRKKIEDSNKAGSYEDTLDLLDKHCPNFKQRGRSFIIEAFRKGEEKVLTNQENCNEIKSKDHSIHKALLLLSQTNAGLSLVTTNFDDFFENEIKHNQEFTSSDIERYVSPYLPLYRDWAGIVYLHGLLSKSPSQSKNSKHELILTSKDVGKAYLSENWATKFLKLIFSEYHICFVGYSLSDPAIKYLVNALSDIRNQNGKEMFALNWPDKNRINSKNSVEGWKTREEEKWKIMGVNAALFGSFETFKNALLNWVDSTELDSIEQPLKLMANPVSSLSSFQKEYMLYELASKEKKFFENLMRLKSTREISIHSSWINEIFNPVYTKKDLRHFGFESSEISKVGDNYRFSMQRHPAAIITDAQPRFLCNDYRDLTELGRNLYNLGRWLLANLEHRAVLENLIVHGPFIHAEFKDMIRESLPQLEKLPIRDKFLYELLLSEKLFPSKGRTSKELFLDHSDVEIHFWIKLVKKSDKALGISFDLKERLKKSLSPCFVADYINLQIYTENSKTRLTEREDITLNQAVLCGDSVWLLLEWINEEEQSIFILEQLFDIIWGCYHNMQDLFIQSKDLMAINKSNLPDFDTEIDYHNNQFNHDDVLALILDKLIKKMSIINRDVARKRITLLRSSNYSKINRIAMSIILG